MVRHLRQRIDAMIANGSVDIFRMDITSQEYQTYGELTSSAGGRKSIGRGEAACIALAKTYDGILASNNLRDIEDYVEEFNLEHITTGDILLKAYNMGLITEAEANKIWSDMLNKRRKLGANSFSEYMKIKLINCKGRE